MPYFEVTLYFKATKSYLIQGDPDTTEDNLVVIAKAKFYNEMNGLLRDGWQFTDLANVAEIPEEE